MKQYKKPVALVAALALMATLLAGCGNGDGGKSAEELSGKEVLAKVQENTQKAKSLSYEMSMQIDLNAEKDGNSQSASIAMDMTADTINEPMQLMMNVNTDLMGTSQQSQIYAEEADGSLVMYTSADNGASWTPTTMDLSQYDVSENLDTYLSMFETVTESGTETVNGVDATKYDCIIPNDKLVDVINASGTLESISGAGMATDELKDMIADLGDLTFTILVDTKTYLPVQYSFDMSDIMDKIMADMIPGTTVDVTKALVQMTITGVDTVDSIERPASIAE